MTNSNGSAGSPAPTSRSSKIFKLILEAISMGTVVKHKDADEFIIGSGNYLRDRGYRDPDATRLRFLRENKDALDREEKPPSTE